MHQFRYGASSFGLEERSTVSVFLLCMPDMSSSSLSSPLNIAWANHTMGGWNYICRERLSVSAGPDIQQFVAHRQGRKHRAHTAPLLKPKRQLASYTAFLCGSSTSGSSTSTRTTDSSGNRSSSNSSNNGNSKKPAKNKAATKKNARSSSSSSKKPAKKKLAAGKGGGKAKKQ